MQLHKLNIYQNNEILREVPFKKGLNLIVNSDSSSAKSGNSVGKSTLSRLLDYLFLSSGEDIYTDSEFKKHIPEMTEYITKNYILIELVFSGFDNATYSIARALTTNPKESDYYIGGDVVDKNKYSKLVSSHIFGQNFDKPSVRNLSHKFIRNTNEKMQKTTKFLHVNSKPDVYDQVYLFLFGFSGLDLLKEKSILNNKIATKKKHLSAYRNPHKESALLKMIKPLKAEAHDLKDKIAKFDFRGSQEGSVKELVQIQGQIAECTVEYSKAETRINYLVNSVKKLKSNATDVNGKELSAIYADAGVSISDELKRSYEDLVVFHNKIVSNKVGLINREINNCRGESSELKAQVDQLHEAESVVFANINDPDILKSIGQMYNELSSIKEKIASVSALLDKIESTKELIDSLEKSKHKIVTNISSNSKTLDDNVELFNEHFGDLSKTFYDERYIFDLTFDLEKEKCDFDIACITPNATGGKKKGELSAFDLAYIKFINETKLKRPTFVVHDSIEDVDINQVFDIFQSANRIEGQYIVAVLSDKISDDKFKVFRKKSVILELSESDKFFRF